MTLAKKTTAANSTPRPPSPIRKEIRGIIFLLLVIILGVSLFSYHPGDSILGIKAGHPGSAHNLFGAVGAHLSGWIFHVLGFSSFWLVVVFLSMAVISFTGKKPFSPVQGTAAALFLIFSFAGLLSLQFPEMISYRGGEVRSGGLAGLTLSRFLEGFVNYFGAYLLLLAIFIISFMSCTRISFGWLFSKISTWSAGVVKRIRENFLKKKEKRRKHRAREEIIRRETKRPKQKVTIIEPKKEPPKKPEQEAFPFMNVSGQFRLPGLDLLNDPPEETQTRIEKESLEMNARRLEKKLSDFGVEGEVVEILPGPVVTMYELKPAAGVKISKVAGLADDLAMALRASGVRIVAPIPGKAAIGIEIANNKRAPVVPEGCPRLRRL